MNLLKPSEISWNILKPRQDCSSLVSCEPCLRKLFCSVRACRSGDLMQPAWEAAVASSIFRLHFWSVESTKRYASRQLLNDWEWTVTRHFCNSWSFLLNIIANFSYSVESVLCSLLYQSDSSPLQSPQLRYLRPWWSFRTVIRTFRMVIMCLLSQVCAASEALPKPSTCWGKLGKAFEKLCALQRMCCAAVLQGLADYDTLWLLIYYCYTLWYYIGWGDGC